MNRILAAWRRFKLRRHVEVFDWETRPAVVRYAAPGATVKGNAEAAPGECPRPGEDWLQFVRRISETA